MSITQSNPTTIPTSIPTIEALDAVDTGDGDHRFFLNHLATVKVAAGESATGMNVVEFDAPRGFGPPLHKHLDEDEVMYVIDGDIRLDLGDDSRAVGTGAIVSLPHGIPHTFQVLSESARFLTVTSGGKGHPTFDQFVQALGAPTDPDHLPAPGEIDAGHVFAVSAEHGIELLGPPPAPLD